MNGLNRVLSICMGLFFGANAISGHGVVGMKLFYNGNKVQILVIQKSQTIFWLKLL
jgi:hypothetical protein